MKLKVLGSSSKGNCYLLENESQVLIIEAGISLGEVKKAIGFKTDKVVGAIITHRHGDHSSQVANYLKAGITILALEDVFIAHNLEPHGSFRRVIEGDGKGYILGGFKIVPFYVVHDVPCVGFLIDHIDMGKMVFLTDTMMCEYTFSGLNHLLIETNYCDEILEKNIQAGYMDRAFKERLMQTHMSLETAKSILKSNDLTAVRNIVLIHLSDGNSDEKRFVSEIEQLTGKVVLAAKSKLEIEVGVSPY